MNVSANLIKLCATCLLALVLSFFLTGCGGGRESHMGVTSHSPASLRFLRTGRQFTALGRFELAKEQYLMALAASNDHELRNVITRELAGVDLMIQAQR